MQTWNKKHFFDLKSLEVSTNYKIKQIICHVFQRVLLCKYETLNYVSQCLMLHVAVISYCVDYVMIRPTAV